MKPIVGYHIIWSTYGFWLPNDERGSWSTGVWAKHLKRFGPATKTNARHSVARRPFDPQRRDAMKASLKFPPVRLTGVQARAAANGMANEAAALGLVVHACAVMPDHVHLVTRSHRLPADELATRLKSATTRRMTQEHVRPLAQFRDRHGRVPTPWAVGGWEVFLHDETEMCGRIRYVESNPEKSGLRPQRWRFVVPYGS